MMSNNYLEKLIEIDKRNKEDLHKKKYNELELYSIAQRHGYMAGRDFVWKIVLKVLAMSKEEISDVYGENISPAEFIMKVNNPELIAELFLFYETKKKVD